MREFSVRRPTWTTWKTSVVAQSERTPALRKKRGALLRRAGPFVLRKKKRDGKGETGGEKTRAGGRRNRQGPFASGKPTYPIQTFQPTPTPFLATTTTTTTTTIAASTCMDHPARSPVSDNSLSYQHLINGSNECSARHPEQSANCASHHPISINSPDITANL